MRFKFEKVPAYLLPGAGKKADRQRCGGCWLDVDLAFDRRTLAQRSEGFRRRHGLVNRSVRVRQAGKSEFRRPPLPQPGDRTGLADLRTLDATDTNGPLM